MNLLTTKELTMAALETIEMVKSLRDPNNEEYCEEFLESVTIENVSEDTLLKSGKDFNPEDTNDVIRIANSFETLKLNGCGSVKGDNKLCEMIIASESCNFPIQYKDYGNELYWIHLS